MNTQKASWEDDLLANFLLETEGQCDFVYKGKKYYSKLGILFLEELIPYIKKNFVHKDELEKKYVKKPKNGKELQELLKSLE